MKAALTGRVYVITGGTKGIGREIATVLSTAGARVVVCGRDAEAGQATIEAVKARGGDGLFVEVDITEVSACEELIRTAETEFGRLDGLVNNAAVFPDCSIDETDESKFDLIFDVNIKASFFCAKFAIEALKRSNGGTIINIGSAHAYAGSKNRATYACSKGALLTLTHHIARNYAGYNIRANWITVGWVITPGELDHVTQVGHDRDWLERQGPEQVPLGRLQTPTEIAAAVLYLASDSASQVTGTELDVTGGFTPRYGQ